VPENDEWDGNKGDDCDLFLRRGRPVSDPPSIILGAIGNVFPE